MAQKRFAATQSPDKKSPAKEAEAKATNYKDINTMLGYNNNFDPESQKSHNVKRCPLTFLGHRQTVAIPTISGGVKEAGINGLNGLNGIYTPDQYRPYTIFGKSKLILSRCKR